MTAMVGHRRWLSTHRHRLGIMWCHCTNRHGLGISACSASMQCHCTQAPAQYSQTPARHQCMLGIHVVPLHKQAWARHRRMLGIHAMPLHNTTLTEGKPKLTFTSHYCPYCTTPH